MENLISEIREVRQTVGATTQAPKGEDTSAGGASPHFLEAIREVKSTPEARAPNKKNQV